MSATRLTGPSTTVVKKLARDIVRTQQEEIRTLRSEDEGLETAGVEVGSLGMSEHETGMEDMSGLRTAKPFDEAFMEMMIAHHIGAVDMAKVELAEGGDPELKTLAQEIVVSGRRTGHIGPPNPPLQRFPSSLRRKGSGSTGLPPSYQPGEVHSSKCR